MSKGSTPRPYSVDDKTFSDNWERTFGQWGVDERSKSAASNSAVRKHNVGSNPTTPATSRDDPKAWEPLVKVMAAYLSRDPIYIDDETGN